MILKNLPWKGQLIIYTGCIYFTSASYTACVPFLPVYLLELGAPEEHIEIWSALVFSSCFLIAGVMAPIWGKISDVRGKKSMALRSSIMLCISYACGGLVTAPIQLLGMRILQGFANGYLPVILSVVSEISPRDKLGLSLSYIQSSQLVGTVSGPLVGGILAGWFGYRASFIIAGIALAFVVFVTALMPDTKNRADNNKAQTTVIQDLKYCITSHSVFEILLLFMFFNMIMLAVQPLLSLFVGQLQGGYADVALYAGIACSLPPFIGAFTAPFWGMFGQRKGYFRSLSLALAGAGVFLTLQSLADSFTELMIYAGFMGLFIVGIVPALNAAITLVTPADFKGRAFGAMTLFGQTGCMIGPLISGTVATFLSLRWQFAISGIMLIIMAVYTGKRFFDMRRRLISLTGEEKNTVRDFNSLLKPDEEQNK